MDHTTHPVACNRSCQDYVNHARHECCYVCHPPPSPAPTIAHCPECRSPVDLPEELAKLSAVVAELRDLVLDVLERSVDGDSVAEE